jgi:hypothetical protein
MWPTSSQTSSAIRCSEGEFVVEAAAKVVLRA